MADFEFKGQTYRLATLDAMTQFHVTRRLGPVMAAISGEGDLMGKVFHALGELSDGDAEYIVAKALGNCTMQQGDAWAKVYVGGRLMFDEIGMAGMITLTFETLKENLSDFFTILRSDSPPAAA